MLFIPAEAYETGGSYEKIRVLATTICRAQLQRPLPPEWQEIHESNLLNADGDPMHILLRALKQNASFTKVSWQDPHVLQKLFARQFPHGTGGFESSVDTIADFKHLSLIHI